MRLRFSVVCGKLCLCTLCAVNIISIYQFAYIESGNYDDAILDIMMPKTDGITVLKK